MRCGHETAALQPSKLHATAILATRGRRKSAYRTVLLQKKTFFSPETFKQVVFRRENDSRAIITCKTAWESTFSRKKTRQELFFYVQTLQEPFFAVSFSCKNGSRSHFSMQEHFGLNSGTVFRLKKHPRRCFLF